MPQRISERMSWGEPSSCAISSSPRLSRHSPRHSKCAQWPLEGSSAEFRLRYTAARPHGHGSDPVHGTLPELLATFLLPNSDSVAPAGTGQDDIASRTRNLDTNQYSAGQNRTRWYGRDRIRKPLLYPAELRDREPLSACGLRVDGPPSFFLLIATDPHDAEGGGIEDSRAGVPDPPALPGLAVR
jgi:hypothetical protein